MKASKKLVTVLLLLIGSGAFSAPTANDSNAGLDSVRVEQVKVISTASDIFYFKVVKELIGAEVEILSNNGEVLNLQIISKKLNLIDFYGLESGSYTIVITKESVVKKIQYEKK